MSLSCAFFVLTRGEMSDEVKENKLTNKQRVFIDEYLCSFNATQSAIKAGYSKKTAYSIGAENLTKPEIKAVIDLRLSESHMSASEVLDRISAIARGDIADLMDITTSGFKASLTQKDADGNITVNPKTKLIKKIKQKVTTYLGHGDDAEDREVIETEMELYSAQEALALMGKYHKLFVDRTELSGPNGGPIPVEAFKAAVEKVYGNND
jgi:phage terminase small subunit